MHPKELRRRRLRLRRFHADSRGYSLLEILVVLSIIALLASVIGIAVYSHLLKARVDTTRQSALRVRQTVIMYRMDRGEECPSVDELRTAELIDSTSKVTDAWDQPFVVKCGDRGEVHVASSGPDKKHGTEDDILAPEPPARVAQK